MKADARDRLRLACAVEPADPRVGLALAQHPPGRVLEMLARGEAPGGARSWPEEWIARARQATRSASDALDLARRRGLRWVTPGHRLWPEALGDLDHLEPIGGASGTPLGLWWRGGEGLDLESAVAVVGARDASTYGTAIARELGADLADRGIVVVSGAAFGIDKAAHIGALTLDRPTVAVLAGGADVDYPRAHGALLARIAETGAVISEQMPGAAPLKARFLSRNRIIAALGLGTVVVEAARRSGSLNTLHWADQLGRVTLGVPGPVTHRGSAGVHRAIRDGKAVLVTCGDEVVEALTFDVGVSDRDAGSASASLEA